MNRTPAEINGYPVVAMVKLPVIDGYLPDLHVVICASPSIARETTYTVWTVAFHPPMREGAEGYWSDGHGEYDVPTLDRALIIMSSRVASILGRQS